MTTATTTITYTRQRWNNFKVPKWIDKRPHFRATKAALMPPAARVATVAASSASSADPPRRPCQLLEDAGQFRTKNVRVAHTTFCSHETVPALVQQLLMMVCFECSMRHRSTPW